MKTVKSHSSFVFWLTATVMRVASTEFTSPVQIITGNSFFQASVASVEFSNGTLYQFRNETIESWSANTQEQDIGIRLPIPDAGIDLRVALHAWAAEELSISQHPHTTRTTTYTNLYTSSVPYTDGNVSLVSLTLFTGDCGNTHDASPSGFSYTDPNPGHPTIRVPIGFNAFACERVEYELTSTNNLGGAVLTFSSENIVLAAFLPTSHNPVVAYNPCRSANDDSICVIRGGSVRCIQEDFLSAPLPAGEPRGHVRSRKAKRLVRGRRSISPKKENSAAPPSLSRFLQARPTNLKRSGIRWSGKHLFLQATHNKFEYDIDRAAMFMGNSDGGAVRVDSGVNGDAMQAYWMEHGSRREAVFDVTRSENSTNANSTGWTMRNLKVYDRDQQWLYLSEDLDSTTTIEVPPSYQAFSCEIVDFTVTSAANASETASWVFHNFVFGAFLADDYDACQITLYNPCSVAGQVCYTKDGTVQCLDNSLGAYSAGVQENIACTESSSKPDVGKSSLEFQGDAVYLQTRAARIDLHGLLNAYSFAVEDNNSLLLNTSGNVGNQLAASWLENDKQRSIVFAFENGQELVAAESPTNIDFRWRLNEVKIADEAGRFQSRILKTSDFKVPPGFDLFYCDFVEFLISDGADREAYIYAEEFFLGAYLGLRYDVCTLRVHNPCAPGQTCRATDGRIKCLNDAMVATGRYAGNQKRICRQNNESEDTTRPDPSNYPTEIPSSACVLRASWSFFFAFLLTGYLIIACLAV
jgi:hypothetical protein